MISIRRVASGVRALFLALLLAACSNPDESRPIEVLFYVDGLSGTRFAVDGLQAANSVAHRLPDRTFEVPFFFVMENARQFDDGDGIRACFRTFADETAPLTIFRYFGTNLQRRVTLSPGQCFGPGYDPDDPPDCDDFVCAIADPSQNFGPEVRFEICVDRNDCTCRETAENAPGCAPGPTPVPENIAFTASVGDFDATNITTCFIPEASASFCTTASIFYLENPFDRVQGIFTKLGGQNDDVDLKADLYIDDDLRTSKSGGGDLVIDEGL